MIEQPDEEKLYAGAMRSLRYEITQLNISEAGLFELNQFKSDKWSNRDPDDVSAEENAPSR